MSGRPPTEAGQRRVELVISLVLRVGVVASLAVIVTGVVAGMVTVPAQRSSARLEHHLLSGAASYPHAFGAVISGLSRGDPASIVALGLVMLAATPVARVAVSVLAFAYQRDRLYVVVTAFVLAVLVGSYFLGTAGG
ncbi:MAG: DUF1634 domain-containing protein [Acidimicrobiales bacterium]